MKPSEGHQTGVLANPLIQGGNTRVLYPHQYHYYSTRCSRHDIDETGEIPKQCHKSVLVVELHRNLMHRDQALTWSNDPCMMSRGHVFARHCTDVHENSTSIRTPSVNETERYTTVQRAWK